MTDNQCKLIAVARFWATFCAWRLLLASILSDDGAEEAWREQANDGTILATKPARNLVNPGYA
jgi:hypothetical protein